MDYFQFEGNKEVEYIREKKNIEKTKENRVLSRERIKRELKKPIQRNVYNKLHTREIRLKGFLCSGRLLKHQDKRSVRAGLEKSFLHEVVSNP